MSGETPQEIAGRFRITSELAKRSTCTVYVAEDTSLAGMEVAVKIFADRSDGSASTNAEFEKEVQALRAASHPVLIPIIAGGVQDNWFYLAMELVRGGTLRDLLKEVNGPLDVREACAIALQVGEALGEIHKQGSVHGHLDSRAILFKGRDPRLSGYCPPTIDRIQKTQTSAGRIIAEPAYMAPEQVSSSSPVSPRTDIYALSVLLFEMITGQRPFSGGTPMQTAMLHVTQLAPSPSKLRPDISPLLDAAIMRGLSKDPTQRFQSAADFCEAVMADQKVPMNPLAEVKPQAESASKESGAATQTIAVSMSTSAIQEILRKTTAAEPPPPPPPAAAPRSSGSAAFAVEATSVGMKTSDLLPGSFMIIDGKRRGERLMLGKPQVMIGSDPGCDVVMNSKGVPPRYALIIQRGDKFFAAPLSPAPVVVNGAPRDAAEETPLQRGDVITVGTEKLRFVAPGEVFTLQENVADRVIDRPKSKLPKILAGTVVVSALAAGSLLYLYNEQNEKNRLAQERARIQKEKEREEVINQLIREGDELFKSGALTLPVGANAEEKFRSVLELKADHPYAKRRLSEIDARVRDLSEERLRTEQLAQRVKQFLTDGEQYFQARAYISPPGKNAKESYEQVLKLDPNNTQAKTRIAEINTILTDQLGRVQETLAQARSLRDAGKFALPAGDNAYELLKLVLDVDPKNSDAKEMILDMAAKSLYEGDKAKQSRQSLAMKQWYVTAKMLGIDPRVIKDRLQGVDLMNRASSDVVIVDRKANESTTSESSQYLDMAEIDRRMANLALADVGEDKRGRKRFIDLSNK